MTVIRLGRKNSKEPPLEFEMPDFMTGCMFMGLCKDSYREDDLAIDMPEEGEVIWNSNSDHSVLTR